MTTNGVLATRAAYALWAPTYDTETVVSALDEIVVPSLTPNLTGRRLLDAGCGTARRLTAERLAGVTLAIGIDVTPEMLARGRARVTSGASLAASDVRALPFADSAFDVVWCRLVAGHVRDVANVYAELARVTQPGGTVIVTDFHADAVQFGHRRTFKDTNGERHVVENHVHDLSAHTAAGARAGLHLEAHVDARVGPEVKHFYDGAHAEDRYAQQLGLALVLAMRFAR